MRLNAPRLNSKSDVKAEIHHIQTRLKEETDEGIKRGIKIYLNELYKEYKSWDTRTELSESIRDQEKKLNSFYTRIAFRKT